MATPIEWSPSGLQKHPVLGILYDPNEPEDVARIERMLEDPATAAKLSAVSASDATLSAEYAAGDDLLQAADGVDIGVPEALPPAPVPVNLYVYIDERVDALRRDAMETIALRMEEAAEATRELEVTFTAQTEALADSMRQAGKAWLLHDARLAALEAPKPRRLRLHWPIAWRGWR